MTARERYRETFKFGRPDRVFFHPQWFWPAAVERWHTEGLPQDVHIEDFFGFDRYEIVPVNQWLCPVFDEEIYYEDENVRIWRKGGGEIAREFKNRPEMSMPHWVEFPVKNEDDWEHEVKPRLDPKSPGRYPLWWDEYVRTVQDRDYPLGVQAGSFFGWPRNLMGLERLSYTLFDNPGLVHKMVEHITDLVVQLMEKAVVEVKPDFALIWEDMAMKTGPLCSPAQFREFLLPGYKRVTEFLRSHGIDIILVDSDGNNDVLVPLWLEGGVTGIYPLERAAECDPAALRRQYGRDLMLMGGIDKRVLARDKAAIEAHLLAETPWLLVQGGWAPFIDHSVPSDVSLENWNFYWDLMRDMTARPEEYLDRCEAAKAAGA